MRIWSFLVLVVLVSVVGGMAQASLSLSNHPRAEATWRPLERERAPGFRPPRACPRQLVWIVFDGLRLDVSRELPFLNELRARGVDASATVPLPSLSRPSYTTMATGAPPAWSGVRNNSFSGPAPLDSVFDRAHEANRSVQARANLAWWNDLFGRGFSSFELVRSVPWAALGPDLLEARASNAAIVLIHVVDLDRIGHSSGVRDEYRRRARELDDELRRGLADLDPTRDVVLVTADHGHRDRGGHGGPEPEVVQVPVVLAGFGARRGVVSELESSAMLAPTLAVLLGLEAPRDGRAGPALSLLDPDALGPEYVAEREAGLRAYREEQAARWSVGSRALASGVAPEPGRLLAAALLFALAWLARALTSPRASLRELLALGVLPLGPWLALRTDDLPLSLSGIVEVEHFALIVFLGALVGVAARVAIAFSPLGSGAEARASALARAGFFSLALAPALWCFVGYRHPGALPAPILFFLPLPLAFAGGVQALLLGALACYLSLRSKRRGEPST